MVARTIVCKIPLLARRTRPSAARNDRVSCIQLELLINFKAVECKSKLCCCMQDTFARATHSAYAAARPSARATIGYLVYKLCCC